jgi:integrase
MVTRGDNGRQRLLLPVHYHRLLPQAIIMTRALTVKGIENLKPRETRYEVPDGEVRGLYLQIFPTGNRSWAFRYRFRRKTEKETLGPYPEIGLRGARDLARKSHGVLASGQNPAELRKAAKAAARPAVDLIEDVVDLYVARHLSTRGRITRSEATRVLKKEVAAPWRGRRLGEITRVDIHDLLDQIKDRAPIQANKVFAWLRAMCNWAVGRGIIAASPCLGIRAPAPAKSRDRVLSDDELKAVWEAAERLEAPYTALIKLLILTGQRRGEVAGVCWSELDLAARVWTLPRERAKNGVEHTIPLSDLAVDIMQTTPRIDGCPFALTISGRRPISDFYMAKQQLDRLLPPGMAPWVLHDIRRSVASGMARLGTNLAVVEKLLNHVSGSFAGIVGVYQRYTFADEKRAAMEVWARHVEQLVSGEAMDNVVPVKVLADRGQ